MSKYPLIKQKEEKLIRDKIPDLIEADGETRNIRRFEDKDELLGFVRKKILEEALEVTEAVSRDDITEELGDLLEIIEKYGELHSITLIDMLKAAEAKAERAGFFEEGFILEL